jgi:hypothetical protein
MALSVNKIAYVWVGGVGFAQRVPKHSSSKDWMVRGDDNFTVLCGYYGYVAWSFDKDTDLSTNDL